MRLGAPVFGTFETPEQWAAAVRAKGYRAAYCPLKLDANEATIHAYAQAAKRNDIVIAEVGAWSNPISYDADESARAIAKCVDGLSLAERIGARCCVNISGSRSTVWDGPHPDNLTEETFERIVEVVREIIDTVQPTRTYYALETMPWAYPDSADSYLQLIRAIARPQFGVHLDPVNIINSPQRYFENAALLRDCFSKLGPYIKSCHAKDICLAEKLTVHLDECIAGTGGLDYAVYLRELNQLDDVPLMLEHLHAKAQYDQAAAYVRSVAQEGGITL